MTGHIVRSGLAFGFSVAGLGAVLYAGVSVPWRWIRTRRAGGAQR